MKSWSGWARTRARKRRRRAQRGTCAEVSGKTTEAVGTWGIKRPARRCVGARWRRMPWRRALRAAWVMARAALGWRAYDPLVAPPRKTGAGCAPVAAFAVAWLAGTQGRRWGAASRGPVPPRPVARRAARKLQPVSPSVVCVLSQHLRRRRARLCLCGHPLSAHQHYRRATECSLCPGCPRWQRGIRRMMRDVKGLPHAMLPSGAELEWMRPPGRPVPVWRPITSP